MSRNTTERYSKKISKEGLLSHEEEVELAKKIEQGDEEARKKLVLKNLRLVIHIAKKYRNQGVNFEDLIQYGIIGLMETVDKFDRSKGYKFSTYAYYWIRQKILRAINNYSRTIRRPAQFNDDLRNLREAEEKLRQENKKVTLENLAEETDREPEKIEKMKRRSKRTLSLDRPVGEKENAPIIKYGERQRKAPIEKERESEILKEALEQTFERSNISDREERIIKLRFGFEDYEDRTLEELGKIFDLSRERVRQLLERTKEELKDYLDKNQSYKVKSSTNSKGDFDA